MTKSVQDTAGGAVKGVSDTAGGVASTAQNAGGQGLDQAKAAAEKLQGLSADQLRVLQELASGARGEEGIQEVQKMAQQINDIAGQGLKSMQGGGEGENEGEGEGEEEVSADLRVLNLTNLVQKSGGNPLSGVTDAVGGVA